jgi:lipopolysaccharide biosynthesis protein
MRRKILVCLHLYYINQADMFAGKIRSALSNYDYDLFVTVNDHNAETEQKFISFKPDAKFIIVKNLGADIFPFITVLNFINLEDYDYIIKLHTKKIYDKSDAPYSPNFFTYIERQFWSDYLTSFLTSENMEKILINFEQNKKLGMVADYRVILRNFKRHRRITTITRDLLKAQKLSRKITYPAGTMFVARARVFDLLKRLNLTESDFHEYSSDSKPVGIFVFPRVMEQFIGNCANAGGLALKDVFTPKLTVFIGKIGCFFKFMFRKTRRFFFRTDNGIIKILKIPIFKLRKD